MLTPTDPESTSPVKLSRLVGSEWVPNEHEGTYRHEAAGGRERIAVAPRGLAVHLLLSLAAELSSPVLILWVLRTPRSSAKPGRYQSPPLPLAEATELVAAYSAFFENDARSDLWLHSRAPEATIVLEEHGLIYAYGPIAQFADVLVRAGLREGDYKIPSPHAHNYHACYDSAEAAFAECLPWSISGLQPEDES